MATIRFKNEQGEWEEANAPKLEIPVKINGVEFDGSKDIDISEIQVSKTQPTDTNIKLWGKVINKINDIDILRQIRDANPTSQLPNLWAESKDPYTEWWDAENKIGVLFGSDSRLDQFASDNNISIHPIQDRNPNKVYILSLQGCNIITLLNINELSLLQYLYCNSNQLTSLDVTGLTSLQYLGCDSNQLTSLNVTGLTSLQYLYCDYNQLTSLNVTGLTSLKYLYCNSNQLTSLDVTGLTSLQYLGCDYNQLTSLDVTGLTSLQYLYCDSNQLTSLNVTGLTSLQYLYCDYNQLTSLDVTGLTSLQYLYCDSNQLTSLDVTGLTSLQYLYCDSNQLTSILSLTSKGLITTANFSDNKFTQTEVSRLLSIGFTDQEIGTQNQ